MLSDGLAAQEHALPVKDIAELLAPGANAANN
jgi:hypothetical protein